MKTSANNTTHKHYNGRQAAVRCAVLRSIYTDNNVIEAYLINPLASGYAGYPAAFTATGKVPGDPLATRISGIVQDNSGQPIADVTMRLYQANLGTHNNEQTEVIPPVLTDANGHFTLNAAPVGLFKLMADGKTAINTGNNYPTLEYDIVTVAGQDNTLGMPIYLPALDPLSTLCVDQNTGGTLTLPTAPGFALTIQAGAATFPGGAKSGCVSVTPVNPDKMPMAPGFGQQPRYIVTIQPVGTSFNPPAALTIPNLDGLAPHAKTEMYSYDHDLAAFVAIGSATVSADGSTIASDPGIGVSKAGWHCGGNPNPTGNAGYCGDCKRCEGSGCVATTGGSCNDGLFCTSADGLSPGADTCMGGSCVGKKIERKTIAGGGQTYDLTKIKDALTGVSTVFDFIPGCGGLTPPAITGEIAMSLGKECCEASKSIVDSTALNGAANFYLPGKECFWPTPFSIGIADLMVKFSASLRGQIAGSGIKSQCKGNCSWLVSSSDVVEISGGGSAVVLDPKIVDVSVVLRGTGNFKVEDACGNVSTNICAGPIQVVATASFGGFSTKEFFFEIPNSQICRGL